MAEASLLALTEEIYDAAAGGLPWVAVGHGLARLVGARTGSLMLAGTGGEELLYHGNIPLEAVLAYRRHFRKVDLWTHSAARAVSAESSALPRVWTSGTLVPDQAFLKSEFWGDFGRRYGLRYVIGTVLPLGAAGALPIGLHRPEGEAPFGEAERRLLEALLPHLRRAMQLRHRLADAAGPAPPGVAALDALALGVLVVDPEGLVVTANLAAEALLGERRALRFARRPGEATTALQVADRSSRDSLGALIRATASGLSAGGALRLADPSGAASLMVLVSPLPRRLAGSALPGREPNRALLLLRPIEPARPPEPEALRTLFGLTPAEARVAIALSEGATKGAVAAARGLSETTVRSQVRAVLEKTGAANLRELARLLGSLPGLHPPGQA